MVKIGAILGLNGAGILLIVGLFGISIARMGYSPYIPPVIPYITGVVTIAFSACGIVGAVLVFRDNSVGYVYLLTAGIAGVICTFIPIYIYDHGYGYIQAFYLCSTAVYIDLVLMLMGGILGFALVEKKERKE